VFSHFQVDVRVSMGSILPVKDDPAEVQFCRLSFAFTVSWWRRAEKAILAAVYFSGIVIPENNRRERAAMRLGLILTLAPILCLLVSACARSLPPDQQADAQAQIDRPLVCGNQLQCDIMWGRAIEFVRTRADYPITHLSSEEIRTKNGGPGLGMVVYKVPDGGGAAHLRYMVICEFEFQCEGAHSYQLRASFVRYVLDGP
jgi:hypothetical protein